MGAGSVEHGVPPLSLISAALAEVGASSTPVSGTEDVRLDSYAIDPIDVWKACLLAGCEAAAEGFEEWVRWNREVGNASTRHWLDLWNNKQEVLP